MSSGEGISILQASGFFLRGALPLHAAMSFGLSTALGALLAGLFLAETEYRHQINVDIALQGIAPRLFSMSVGMGIDWGRP